MNRRKFLWTGAIFVPAAKSIAQAGLRSPAFVGRLNKPAAGSSFTYYATEFDSATPDYLLKSTDPGFSDSKLGIFSCWVKFSSGDAANQRFLARASLDFHIYRTSANTVRVLAYNGNGSTIGIQMTSTATVTADGNWHHILASWDTSGTNCWIAIDGTEGTTINARNDVTCDYTFSGWYFSFDALGLNAAVCEPYFAPGQSLGAFSSANVLKFRTSGSKPADLGTDGSTPTGSQPGVYFRSPYSSFGTNSGTGGNFTVNGTLASATAP